MRWEVRGHCCEKAEALSRALGIPRLTAAVDELGRCPTFKDHKGVLQTIPTAILMTEHKSFRVSDFSLRDLPWAVAAYLVLSIFSVGLGLFLDSLPSFWSGLLLGAGGAFIVAFFLLRPVKKKVDVAALPSPSANVRAKCDDPSGSFVEAVKAYRVETGLGLAEATAVLRNYQASKQHRDRTQS